jgi:pyruvate carboxylase
MQGGTYLGYSSVTEVREISNLTVDDISDSDLYKLVQKATAYLNAEINARIIRERILAIDETRTNKIDGTNATFYVRQWNQHIGDMDNDGKVTTSDITVYQVDSANVETQLTVSSISPDEGKFILATAPSGGVRLYVTYEWCYVSEYTPHPLVKLACEYLTTAFAFEKVERGLSPEQVYGNVRIYRDMTAGSENHKRYREVVLQINSQMIEYNQAPLYADKGFGLVVGGGYSNTSGGGTGVYKV